LIRNKSLCVFQILIPFLALVFPARAQGIVDSTLDLRIHKGIGFVYNLSFDSARSEFQEVIRLEPGHPAGHFFLAMVEWWRIMIDMDNESNDQTFLSMLDKSIEVCESRLDNNENDLAALFFKGGAVGFRGRLHANRDDWLKAANDGRIALPIVQKAYQLAPNNSDILLGIGIYNYYAAVVPEQYPVVKPLMLFFPSGDKQKGIRQLRKASEIATYANIEASYFLLQLLYNYEKAYNEALPIAEKLFRQFPNNVVFHRYVGRCQTAVGQWEDSHNTYDEILRFVRKKKLGYNSNVEREAEYYLGFCEMTALHYDTALQHFYRCDELSRTLDRTGPSGFMVMTNLRVGMVFDIQSKRDLAVAQYNKVLGMTDYQNAHELAERYLKTSYKSF